MINILIFSFLYFHSRSIGPHNNFFPDPTTSLHISSSADERKSSTTSREGHCRDIGGKIVLLCDLTTDYVTISRIILKNCPDAMSSHSIREHLVFIYDMAIGPHRGIATLFILPPDYTTQSYHRTQI